MQPLINLLLTTFAVLITAYILPGVKVSNFFSAIAVAVVMAIINTFIKPILLLISLPVTVLTLGLFTFVINGLIVLLVSFIVPGFEVKNIFWAILFSLVLSVVNSILSTFK